MSDATASGDAKDVIVFSLNGHWMAIESCYVQEVIEPVSVSPLPMVPVFINGLINLNGAIVPQLDLAAFIALPQVSPEKTQETLIVIEIKDQLLALKVGAVQEPLALFPDALQGIDVKAEANTFQAPFFSARFNYQTHSAGLFSLSSLDNVVQAKSADNAQKGFLGELQEEKTTTVDVLEYLSFRCAGLHYACLLTDIFEVVDVTSINKQPGSADDVLGVSLIRGMPTLVLDFQRLLERAGATSDGMTKGASHLEEKPYYSLLVMQLHDVYCALYVDAIIGLELVNAQQLHPGKLDWQQAILAADNSVIAQAIALPMLFDEAYFRRLSASMPSLQWYQKQQRVKQRELLHFTLAGEDFALYLDDVHRIVSDVPLHGLLEQQAFVIGAIDFEGKVTAVVDLALQLGYQGNETVREFIVINDGVDDWALAVTEVKKILKVDETTIDTLTLADGASAENLDMPVAAYTTVNDALLSILDVKSICGRNLIPNKVSM